MHRTVRAIDRFTAIIGKTAAWLTLAMVLLTTYLVVMRYVFSVNSIAMQELVTYMHATVFMLGAAYVLQTDSHVRVDIFYRGFTPRRKALANIFGTLFLLLPFALLFLFYSWHYAAVAWRYHEGSAQAGGLPYVYWLKTLLPAFSLLMILQSIAELLRNILSLSGKIIVREER